jgi:hypothetical protein
VIKIPVVLRLGGVLPAYLKSSNQIAKKIISASDHLGMHWSRIVLVHLHQVLGFSENSNTVAMTVMMSKLTMEKEYWLWVEIFWVYWRSSL